MIRRSWRKASKVHRTPSVLKENGSKDQVRPALRQTCRGEITPQQRPLDTGRRVAPAVVRQQRAWRRVAQMREPRRVTQRQHQWNPRSFSKLTSDSKRSGSTDTALGASTALSDSHRSDGRHGVRSRAQSHIPYHQGWHARRRAIRQALQQPRLLHVQRSRLHRRSVHRVHHFARPHVTDAPDAIRDHHLVAAEFQLEHLPLGLGHVPQRAGRSCRAHPAAGVPAIERQPAVGQDVAAHAAHQLHVEVHVVQPQQLPALRLRHLVQMKQVGDGIVCACGATALRNRSAPPACGRPPAADRDGRCW